MRELVEEALYIRDCALSMRGSFYALMDQCQQAWLSAPAERRKAVVANLTRSGGPDRQFTVLVYNCIDDLVGGGPDVFSAMEMEQRGRAAAICVERAQRSWRPTKPPAL